jgi:hypothetical protein
MLLSDFEDLANPIKGGNLSSHFANISISESTKEELNLLKQ